MKKTLQIYSALILFLFLFPVIINYLPDSGSTISPTKLLKEPSQIVYASNIVEEEKTETIKGKALLYFTHSHEAYEQVTKAKNGKIAVNHQTENITKFGENLKAQLSFNNIETKILPITVPYSNSYKAIRPHVENSIKEENYDIIIDLHRDSAGPEITTSVHEGEKYAKVAFVVGLDNPNFMQNQTKTQVMKDEMELLVPGITRNTISKGKTEGDGRYNQDLHPSLMLIELGGIGNSEVELNRTIAVIAKAASQVIEK